ncbi:hypothetical protein B1R32_103143 [Abditibacterium utsteinense]|uniref:Uncharacterized protein n=1 Tax=Abditibacterium utsteinense TaxID=1960156 RepID=A0A2S8SVP7_9BACT|nr:hypothetical protein [Abditibacterium utsteinense]PQV64876.1 hypothetical protein B1R32_103143 [Abditibacterium utsteinense]
MRQRFHPRETALLLAPVLLIGVLGFWMSKRPIPKIDDGKLHPQFRLDKPSALEAFRGANTALVISFKGASAKDFDCQQLSPYLQVKTSRGVEVARYSMRGIVPWDENLWNYSSSNNTSTRFLLQTRAVPAGEMHFGFFGVAQPNASFTASPTASAPLKPVRLSGKWKVDRTQFKPTNIASWPRKPFVKVREVVITEKTTGNPRGGVPNRITGEIIFDLQSATMEEKTSFEASFSEHHFTPPTQITYGMSYGSGQTKETPRTRAQSWMVNSKSPKTRLNVSGRVSADNRWPLGFTIEPFNFQNVKVGQKLKFKQFPVPLPKP